eukprot:COSAG03_NODE_4912_length_1395_cov_517.052469_1_plen_48_part_10
MGRQQVLVRRTGPCWTANEWKPSLFDARSRGAYLTAVRGRVRIARARA